MEMSKERHSVEFSIRYGMRAATLHAKYYRHAGNLILWLQVVIASAGFVTAFSSGEAAMAAGLTTAFLAGIQLVYRPSEREAYELSLHKEYGRLNTAFPQLSTEEAERLVRATYETPEYEKEFIRYAAFNDVVDELGYDVAHKNSLTRTQRVLAYLLL